MFTLFEFIPRSCLMSRLKLLHLVLLLWPCSIAGPMRIAPKKIKMFVCTEFWVFCCCFHHLRFVLAFAKLQCAYIIFCFSCKWGRKGSTNWISLVNYVSHLLWKRKLFSIENLNSQWRIRWHGDQNYQWWVLKTWPWKIRSRPLKISLKWSKWPWMILNLILKNY